MPGNFITVMGATGNTNPIHLLTFIAALGSGLVAGIFFAFSNFVMKNKLKYFPSTYFSAFFGAKSATIFSKRDSPRNPSQSGCKV